MHLRELVELMRFLIDVCSVCHWTLLTRLIPVSGIMSFPMMHKWVNIKNQIYIYVLMSIKKEPAHQNYC